MNNDAIRIEACSTAAGVNCPDCGGRSSRMHSSYQRLPADMPSAGRQVVLCLRVRRFICPAVTCERRTFVEQLPGKPGDTVGGRNACVRSSQRSGLRSPAGPAPGWPTSSECLSAAVRSAAGQHAA
ncbi:transposase family protein [Streptomyces sp. NPDC059262]|uniref:transposase family protein n=1 Tax=Streptomyces sp. NPDC059262 TaxID=3346797 RepID=UPI0036C5A09A